MGPYGRRRVCGKHNKRREINFCLEQGVMENSLISNGNRSPIVFLEINIYAQVFHPQSSRARCYTISSATRNSNFSTG